MSDDVRVKVRSTKEQEGRRGQRILSLYLTQEEAANLVAGLQANAENEKGVKIMVNIYNNTNSATGSTFISSEAFVKGVQEFTKKSFEVKPKTTAAVPKAEKASAREAYRNLNKTVE